MRRLSVDEKILSVLCDRPSSSREISVRLDLIQRLKKKYGGSVEAVLATGRRVQEELQLFDNHEVRTAELIARLEEEARRLHILAQQLSKKRIEAAKRMTTLVGAELAALKMEQAIFQVTVVSDESPICKLANRCVEKN